MSNCFTSFCIKKITLIEHILLFFKKARIGCDVDKDFNNFVMFKTLFGRWYYVKEWKTKRSNEINGLSLDSIWLDEAKKEEL